MAAQRRLRAINSGVSVEGIVADVGPKNAEELLHGFPLILDGTDNFETRFLLNDVAIHLDVTWIYAAVVASYGVTLTVHPRKTACLACALEIEARLPGTENGACRHEAPHEALRTRKRHGRRSWSRCRSD